MTLLRVNRHRNKMNISRKTLLSKMNILLF